MKIVNDSNPSFYDEFYSEKCGVHDLNWNVFFEFSDDEEDKTMPKDKKHRNTNHSFVQDWVLRKICKKYKKKVDGPLDRFTFGETEKYTSVDDYMKDRNMTINEIKNYLHQESSFFSLLSIHVM